MDHHDIMRKRKFLVKNKKDDDILCILHYTMGGKQITSSGKKESTLNTKN